MRRRWHHEGHRTGTLAWLRAAVLGANDGIVSTASLMLGVAASSAPAAEVLLTGVAGLVAGALSMAAGEFVSVSSQADTERAEVVRERRELADEPAAELKELTTLYVQRGVSVAIAAEVARQLTAHDALGAHLRDELGLTDAHAARPLVAALASAAAFAVGALVPLVVLLLTPGAWAVPAVVVGALTGLALAGLVAARVSGTGVARAVARLLSWGALAMGVTALIGRLFGAWLNRR
jgi:VIT1/CCC1 family predicted Fe2+/Mn2+ transporter